MTGLQSESTWEKGKRLLTQELAQLLAEKHEELKRQQDEYAKQLVYEALWKRVHNLQAAGEANHEWVRANNMSHVLQEEIGQLERMLEILAELREPISPPS